ncbi:ankyrin repeat domain-containing protein [Neolewinella antarctica]|uniref:Ankyrin repeat protein n=1 Tax=Neolewinella antarctica TaxID=442734 RepID=A0ABX0X7U0_9BACT|nr:ankyrin repeat domain-containing protein [Neolewinella antarctica]NJC25271.1 ankyrin repeat protein [Neolewinella antarctica]
MLKYPCFLFVALLFQCAEPTPDEVLVLPEITEPDPTAKVDEIAGYDVSHLDVYGPTHRGLPPQKMGKSHVLFLAAAGCDTALMRQTLADGANPDIAFDTSTPLVEALYCADGSVAAYELLKAAGADGTIPQLSNVNGYQPLLHYAVKTGNLPLIERLLADGADAEERDEIPNLGCKPIHAARDSATLTFFLSRGVTLDENCNFNRTLLHNAVLDQAYDFVEYLLRKDLVDEDFQDNDGDTAYDYAVIYQDQRMMDLLEVYLLN